jgi:hypothetical protein
MMVVVWIVVILLLIYAWRVREGYTDPESPVTRPERNTVWLSKIDAEAPIGGNDDDYLRALTAFYDKVYAPAQTKPKDTDVEAFLSTPDAQIPGVDLKSLRKIIVAAFDVELTSTAAAREQQQLASTGALVGFKGENLQPSDGVDQVYGHMDEQPYLPVDMRQGELPEGVYDPTIQQPKPRREVTAKNTIRL